jgi:hypothetical protein
VVAEEGEEMNNGTGHRPKWELMSTFDGRDVEKQPSTFGALVGSIIGYAILSSLLALVLAGFILCWRFLWWVVMG